MTSAVLVLVADVITVLMLLRYYFDTRDNLRLSHKMSIGIRESTETYLLCSYKEMTRKQ
jgi:hypothetical protein